MEFIPTQIPDLILCKPSVHYDDRGYFMETFRKESLEAVIGNSLNFIQDNESQSIQGVLRGLHYQLPPYDQAKLVRVIKGAVLDVAVDIRARSATFGKVVAVELNDKNKCQLFIPRGFAHGYAVLSDEAIFSYKVDNYYHQESERGIMYNDPVLNIDWQLKESAILVSDKDKNLSSFIQADKFDSDS
jgi:dTDP-4-dehydrorhamnose 3,5-epimerase